MNSSNLMHAIERVSPGEQNLITGLYDLDEAKAHTCIQKQPSKYGMCHQDERVIQQIMSCWAAVG